MTPRWHNRERAPAWRIHRPRRWEGVRQNGVAKGQKMVWLGTDMASLDDLVASAQKEIPHQLRCKLPCRKNKRNPTLRWIMLISWYDDTDLKVTSGIEKLLWLQTEKYPSILKSIFCPEWLLTTEVLTSLAGPQKQKNLTREKKQTWCNNSDNETAKLWETTEDVSLPLFSLPTPHHATSCLRPDPAHVWFNSPMT